MQILKRDQFHVGADQCRTGQNEFLVRVFLAHAVKDAHFCADNELFRWEGIYILVHAAGGTDMIGQFQYLGAALGMGDKGGVGVFSLDLFDVFGQQIFVAGAVSLPEMEGLFRHE